MSGRPDVVVVCSVLNHAATLRALLDALDATDWPGLRAIFVDCGSSDGSRTLLQERAARARVPLQVLDAPGLGRASALRLAMDAAGRADVVRVHADVVPDGADWLQRLFAVFARERDVGIVGAKVVLGSGRIQTCGRNLINGLGIWPEWSDLRWMEGDRDEGSRPTEVDGVGGELCWITRATLDATGGLDTNYDPVFGDDDDLCLLARWHGFRVLVEPGVRGVHFAPRQTQLTSGGIADPTGLVQRQHDERQQLQRAHRDYFQQKWGFDPEAPDLHEVRRRYGHTRICWRIGERLLQALPPEPAVDVCLVTWNSRAVLPRMLDQLAATDWPDVRVWVTDNGSTDDTVAYLHERARSFPFPLQVECLPQNLGVAQALNLAFRRGDAPIVARLDDDAFVPPQWLRGLVPNFHQRPYAGLVGPRSLHANAGEALQNGPSRGWPGPIPGTGPTARDRVLGKARVHAICGCCNLYRRAVFTHVGYLDVRFSPSQFDESDHHVAMHMAGYEAIYDGSVTVHHLRQAGRGETPTAVGNFAGNRAKHLAKWAGRPWHAIDRAIDLSIDGRFLPADGDTSALRAALPPVPDGPPRAPERDAAEIGRHVAMARRRSLVRTRNGPLAAWWDNQVALCEQSLRHGDGITQSLVSRLRDLLPYEARAQLAIAANHAQEGDLDLAARRVRWARWLAPDDAAVAQRAEALRQPAALLVPQPRSAARVVLLPPMVDDHATIDRAVRGVAASLQAAGVTCRIERDLVPDVQGAEVVHAFGLGDPFTLVGRLQSIRASHPRCRIVLSPLQGDPGPGNWAGHVFGGNYFADAAALQRLFAAAAAGAIEIGGSRARSVPAAFDRDRRDYEQRCLASVDTIAVFTAAEHAHWLAHGVSAARLQRLPETVDQFATDGEGPRAGQGFGGALAIGPRDLPGYHLAMALALQGSGVPLTLMGPSGHPFGDWHLRQLGGSELRLEPDAAPAEQMAALRRSAVLLFLHENPTSFALPLQAAAAGCELVLARTGDAVDLFGDRACYVDPCDLSGLRAAVTAARRRWPQGSAEPWRRALAARHSAAACGAALCKAHGLPNAVPGPLGEVDRTPALIPSFA